MSAKSLALCAVLVLVVSATLPVAARADFGDGYFILGKWTYKEETNEGDTSEKKIFSYSFRPGGKGVYEAKGKSDGPHTQSDYSFKRDFEWRFKDINSKTMLQIVYYEGESNSVNWDNAENYEYAFESGNTKVYLSKEYSHDSVVFKKTGWFAGTLFPFCFMYFALPVSLLGLGITTLGSRRRLQKGLT